MCIFQPDLHKGVEKRTEFSVLKNDNAMFPEILHNF